jgi:biopolymer transport protein ExbD
MNYKNRLFITYIITLSIFGCTTNDKNYEDEAIAFCEAHNPLNWVAYQNRADAVDLKKALDKRLSQVIESDEFNKIINALDQVVFSRQLYPTAQSKISALIGKDWECKYYQAFYAIDFVQYPTPLDSDSDAAVILAIDDAGNFSVNAMKLIDNRVDTLKRGIVMAASASPPKVIIQTSPSAPKEALNAALDLLRKLKVKKVSIITPQS